MDTEARDSATKDSSPYVLGIDLGGSAIKLGLFSSDGTCLEDTRVATPRPATPEKVLATMLEAIAGVDPEGAAIAIGVGSPGPVSSVVSMAHVSTNLDNWDNVALDDWLEEKTNKPVVLANDANCAGMGEAWLGAGREFRNFIMLTLGTGVGGAIILDGKLFVGPKGTAGELGLITIDLYGPECHSGNRGSLEQYVSLQGIRRQSGMEPDRLAHAAKAGDSFALEFWKNYGHLLGAGLANSIYVLNPEAIVIGGGIAASAEFFLPSTWTEIERRVLPESRKDLQIITAELGAKAGIAGAAKLAWQRVEDAI
ncbi:MAG: ROK family protein [Oscillatoria sp. SIO1A7]|nr:ROK family protein [Oscillatoria sp. SIO1A7]